MDASPSQTPRQTVDAAGVTQTADLTAERAARRRRRVLRLARHHATPQQLAELHRIFQVAPADVIQHSETVADAARIKELLAQYEADILEVVLPLPLIAQCLDPRDGVGVPVIRAVMDRRLEPNGDVSFSFSHYEQIKRVIVEVDRL